MKAVVYYRYGSPDVLSFADVQRPEPGPGQVLVRVHAAAVNPADWRLLRADPFLVRLMGMGFWSPKRPILGADVAGVVEELGQGVTRFVPGDAVFGGSMELGSGSFAEYLTVPADALTLKPRNLDFEQAAAVPMAALTALLGLRDVGQVQTGQKVLIQGASGGVGTFAVQLAKHFGAQVTAVTSTRNVQLVHSLGADHVIDYTISDWTLDERLSFDLILGVAGSYPLSSYARALSPRGRYVCVGGGTGQMLECMLLGKLYSLLGQKSFRMLNQVPQQADLELVARLCGDGRLRAVIDRRYELAEVPDALRYVEQGHARGKVVIPVRREHQEAGSLTIRKPILGV